MAAAAAASVGFGRVYDRFGLRGLFVLPLLAAAVPPLAFSNTVALLVIGALVWGAATGVHDSTMRAAVADLVPAGHRGAGYGTFTAIYGLAWLGGAVVIGALYDHGTAVVAGFVLVVQAIAVALLVPVIRG